MAYTAKTYTTAQIVSLIAKAVEIETQKSYSEGWNVGNPDPTKYGEIVTGDVEDLAELCATFGLRPGRGPRDNMDKLLGVLQQSVIDDQQAKPSPVPYPKYREDTHSQMYQAQQTRAVD